MELSIESDPAVTVIDGPRIFRGTVDMSGPAALGWA